MAKWVIPSSSCVVKPLPFSLHVFLVQPNVTLWRPLFTFPFWLIALAVECIVLDGFQHSLWSLFPVLYLLAWKQLKKCRCFFHRVSWEMFYLQIQFATSFSPYSVALKISSRLQCKVFFLSTSFKQWSWCAPIASACIWKSVSVDLHSSSVK